MKEKKSEDVPEKNDRIYAINSKGQAAPENAPGQQQAHQQFEQQGQQGSGEVQTSIGQPDSQPDRKVHQSDEPTRARNDRQQR